MQTDTQDLFRYSNKTIDRKKKIILCYEEDEVPLHYFLYTHKMRNNIHIRVVKHIFQSFVGSMEEGPRLGGQVHRI